MNIPVITANKRKLELDKKLKQIENDELKLKKLEESLKALQPRVATQATPIIKEFCDLRFENLTRLKHHLSDSSVKKKDKRHIKHLMNELAFGLQGMGDLRAEAFLNEQISEEDLDLKTSDENTEFEPHKYKYTSSSDNLGESRAEIKSLFRQLAKVFHPDKEPLEHLKEERTSLMKKITEAYENQDLSGLLKLEKEHLGPREFTEDKVELYIKHINDRLKELKIFEADLKKYGPLSTIYRLIYSQKITIQEYNIMTEISKLAEEVKNEREFQQIIWDNSTLKSFLKTI